MKNSRVWQVVDTDICRVLGRLLSTSAREALKLAREFWPSAGTIHVQLVKKVSTT
ncbi:MAG: hypothetical protein OK454_00595 [Thaumarchaeota archaeon]|nr:hypothetical protein [Nitrososphaerota archaeon]